MAVSSASRPSRARFTASVAPLELGDVSFDDLVEHFHERRGFALLHSQTQDGGLGRFSFFAFEPFARLWTADECTVSWTPHRQQAIADDIFTALQSMLDDHSIERRRGAAAVPFVGGAIGYFGYGLGRHLEALPNTARDDLRLPDCHLAFYSFAVILEHESGQLSLAHLDRPDDDSESVATRVLAELRRVKPGTARRCVAAPLQPGRCCECDLSRQDYLAAVRRIKEYIVAGDVYQVNMTQRFRAALDMSAWDLYRRLADINPAPFAAFLTYDDHTVVSSSPERFLHVQNRIVETRPIKGTIRRGQTPDEDRQNQSTLFYSAKNRAELAMIVDLLRNDIGRVSTPGTVDVRAGVRLETYSSLHHLVATITSELAPPYTIVDLIKATFPGGSITGAPKIRAMEIIDELEPVARGLYTGSIGYLGFDGAMDLNIAIRTVIVRNGVAYIHAGGGIVADSDAADEYDESLLKACRLLQAVGATMPRA